MKERTLKQRAQSHEESEEIKNLTEERVAGGNSSNNLLHDHTVFKMKERERRRKKESKKNGLIKKQRGGKMERGLQLLLSILLGAPGASFLT